MGYNPGVGKKLKKRDLFVILLVAVGGFLFGQLILKSFTKLILSDFHVYYYITKVVMKYEMHPYANYTPIYPYYFPPASLLLLWPLTTIPFYIAKIIFTVINSFLLILSVYLINKMLIGKINYHFWLMISSSLLFYPLRFTFSDGQFNVVMLAIYTVGLYALYKNGVVLGGLGLGLGVITKISPAIILVYGILRKKFNLIMVAGTVVILMSLGAEYFVKKDINYYYAKFIVKDVSNQSSGLDSTDQSILSFIKRITKIKNIDVSPMKKSLLSYSVIGVFGISFFIIDFKTKRSKYTLFIDYFILTIVGVIGTGLAWYHQYTALLLPLLGTSILIFIKFDKKYKIEKFFYTVGIVIVYLSWFANLRSDKYYLVGYSQFIMLYGAILLLLGLYVLKLNQKWLVEVDRGINLYVDNKYFVGLFLITTIIGLNPIKFSENMKEGRDQARLESINFMSEVLKTNKVIFKPESSNSFIMSNRVGKGYIRFGKGEDSKVLDRMYILYEDPINNSAYNYSFKSDSGEDFELKAKMESKKNIDEYGSYYTVDNRVD